VPTPEQMQASVIARPKEWTGKDIDEWVRLVRESGIEGQPKQRTWLKQNFGFGQNTTFVIVDVVARESGWTPPSDTN